MNVDRPTSPKLIRDLMTVGVPTCPPDTPVVTLAQMMLERDFEAVVVLNQEDGHALGVVGREDLVRAYTRPGAHGLKAEAVMHEGLPKAPPDIPLEAAAHLMLDTGVRCLFLTHTAAGVEYPAAMITYKHLIRHLAASSDEELQDLGIEAQRQSPMDEFIRRRDAARKKSKQ